MKKLFAIICMIFLVFPVFSSVHAIDSSSTTNSVVDEKVWSAFSELGVAQQVIITFKGDEKPTTSQISLVAGLGIESAITMQSLPIIGAIATKQQVEQLANNDEVLSIYLNEKLTYYNADATAITGVDKAQIDAGFKAQNGGFPVSGDGVGVVINDSGVDGTHKDHQFGKNLLQNVLGTTNLQGTGIVPISYTEDVINTDTNSGHGTHVAGTVGGTGALSGGKYEGAAPGADLIGYGSGGALFILDGIGGFDYAVTHQREYNIRVITNSWGSSGGFDPNDPINVASKKAYDRGIVVLFAAGNSGPTEDTHNPYSKAPWVISVGAGEKDGTLADFSSRGTKDVGGTFDKDGKTWTWTDAPTVVAPGVDIVSTRTVSPVTSLAADVDAATLEPAHLPYYTTMSGTSMATPHAAGVVALLLEADSSLSPNQVKNILQLTATNMPGYESFEVGAGYLNAYAALDAAYNGTTYGATLNSTNTFNANVSTETTRENYAVDYTASVSTQHSFTVAQGMSTVFAKANATGLFGETGNPVNLVLIDPQGTEYSSGISLLFPITYDRTVIVNNPLAGEWKLEIRGLRGDTLNPVGIALPETVQGSIAFTKVNGLTGLSDISGHPAAVAIAMGVENRLLDSYATGKYKPDEKLSRADLAKYLVMGAEIRQSSSVTGLKDVTSTDAPYANAVIAKGAAFRDYKQTAKGVMLLGSNGTFESKGTVTKAELAYSLVQSLGLQEQAEAFTGDVTVQYKDERFAISDQASIPAHLKGYV